jgi:hypothetical protein
VTKGFDGPRDESRLGLAYSGKTSQEVRDCHERWQFYIKEHLSEQFAVKVVPTREECRLFPDELNVHGRQSSCLRFSLSGLRDDQCPASPVLRITSPVLKDLEFSRFPDAQGSPLDIEIDLPGCAFAGSEPRCQPPLEYTITWCAGTIDRNQVNVDSCISTL